MIAIRRGKVPKNVYLCSRVAYDARPFNNIVAQSLRDVGFEVYVPHEQAPNNLSQEDIEEGRYDKETIFRIDFEAMNKADLCVVVGRFGKDCSWEIAWFFATGIPIYFVSAGDETWQQCPMIIPSLSQNPKIEDPALAGTYVKFLQKVRPKKFWEKVKIGGPNECWPWTRFVEKNGYARAYTNGKRMAAHRVAFLLAKGPIPDSLNVLHKCDNRKCCNPSHLFLGTHQDNILDAISKNRIPRLLQPGSKHRGAKLKEADVLFIREQVRSGKRTRKELAEKFGVSYFTICAVVSKQHWNHI
jgi:nucleoside 2-deoxyribosyltransferase